MLAKRVGKDEMTKKERLRLLKMVNEYLVSIGAEKLSEHEYWSSIDEIASTEWMVDTKAGPLTVYNAANNIFCRFESPERAVEVLGEKHFRLNPHSGKYNFHFGRNTAQEAFDHFKEELGGLLKPSDDAVTLALDVLEVIYNNA